jgi:hypothetical protein
VIAAGWAATLVVAVFRPGGHPPLSAYVGLAVAVGSLFLAPVGLVLGVLALRERRRGRLTAGDWSVGLAVFGNAVWVLLGLQVALQ